MRIIKNSQNFTRLQYLLLSQVQLMAFDYLEKPIKTIGGQLIHKIKTYAEAFEDSDIQNKEKITKVVNYFKKISREDTATEVVEIDIKMRLNKIMLIKSYGLF